MQLHIRKCQRIDLFQPGEFGLVLCGRIPQHLSCLIVMIDLIGQHTIIDEPAAAEGLRKLLFLKPAGIDPEPKSFEITVHLFFSPLTFYVFPDHFDRSAPAVIRQKLLLQKYSFHSFFLISGYSFFSSLLLALLYALMNLLISVAGFARNIT